MGRYLADTVAAIKMAVVDLKSGAGPKPEITVIFFSDTIDIVHWEDAEIFIDMMQIYGQEPSGFSS